MQQLLLAALAAVSVPSPAAPTCAELLTGLRAKVEADYAGYHLEIRGARRTAHDRRFADLTRRAAATTTDACLPILRDYIDWFRDPHLFVYQNPQLDTAETARRAATLRRMPVDEAAVRRDLVRRGAKADPLEGIWYDRGRRIAVIPDPERNANRFLGVVVVSDTSALPVGAVVAVFERRGAACTAELTWPTLAVTSPPCSLHRSGTLLRLSPTMWGKRFPGPASELAVLDTTNVRRPTLTWRGGTAIFSVLSHDGQYRRVIDSLVAAHRERLAAAEAVLIDLRGNEGGGSQTTAALDPYVVGERRADPRPDFGASVMLASPDQIWYAKRAFGPDTSAFVRRIVAAMEAAPGTLVPLFDPADTASSAAAPDPAPLGPTRVAVLIDGGTVSASEVLVLRAKRSARARVIGTPTAGALDYQSTSIVRIHREESRWMLGYPTITAHARLPEGGMRGKGIAPDVVVDWAKYADPYAEARRVLK